MMKPQRWKERKQYVVNFPKVPQRRGEASHPSTLVNLFAHGRTVSVCAAAFPLCETLAVNRRSSDVHPDWSLTGHMQE